MNIVTIATSEYTASNTPSLTSQASIDEIFDVSLITLAWIFPTLVTLKYPTERVCKWLKAVRRISLKSTISSLQQLRSLT